MSDARRGEGARGLESGDEGVGGVGVDREEQAARRLCVGEQQLVVLGRVVPQSTNSDTNAWFRWVPPATNPARTSAGTPSMTGTAARSTCAPTPEPRASSPRCPSSPKPVTSVTAWTASPRVRPASRAPALSVVMTSTAVASSSGPAPSRFTAVEITPSPIGLLSTSTSSGRPPAFRHTRSGSTVPTTASPYFGSGSSMEWPPAISAPAARATSAPPSMTRARSSKGRPSRGHATRLSASSGAPPMAYTSLERVGGGDATPVVGVVDDRREEVGGEDEREVVADPVHRGVVGGVEPDDQVRVVGWLETAHEPEDRAQVVGGELAGAARAVGEAGEPELGAFGCRGPGQVRTRP